MNAENAAGKEKRIIISWGHSPACDDAYEEHRLSREEMYKVLDAHKRYLANPSQYRSFGLSFTCNDGVEVSYDIREIVRIIIHDAITRLRKDRPKTRTE